MKKLIEFLIENDPIANFILGYMVLMNASVSLLALLIQFRIVKP